MGTRWRPAVGIAVLCVALAACTNDPHRSSTPGRRPPPGPTTQRLDEQETANRNQAEDEARGLLDRARIPPGAVALDLAPAELRGAALGIPVSGTYVNLARYWRVPLPFTAVDGYVRQHPPAHLVPEGSSSETRQAMITHAYAWDGQVLPSSQGGQLSITVLGSVAAAAGGDETYLRVVAGSPWLDPHPLRDSADGPRLRLENGQSCPVPVRAFVGVSNDGAEELDGALVPDGTPTSGRVCLFTGKDDPAFALVRQRTLTGVEAAEVAAAARSVELAHPELGIIACPPRHGATLVAVLAYPGRPAVDLFVRTSSCPSASNGHLIAVSQTPRLRALVDLLNQATG